MLSLTTFTVLSGEHMQCICDYTQVIHIIEVSILKLQLASLQHSEK